MNEHVGSKLNTADKFYDDLLPLLLKKPLDAALVDSGSHTDDDLCPLRTNERAVLTGYRCVREAWMHYLHSQGASSNATLHVHLNYQLQWLKMLLQDLHLVGELDESDIRLARLGPMQVTHYCTKRVTTEDTPRVLDEQLHQLQETCDGVEARLADIKISNYGVSSQVRGAVRGLSSEIASVYSYRRLLFARNGLDVFMLPLSSSLFSFVA